MVVLEPDLGRLIKAQCHQLKVIYIVFEGCERIAEGFRSVGEFIHQYPKKLLSNFHSPGEAVKNEKKERDKVSPSMKILGIFLK